MPDQFQALITEMSTSSLPQLWVDPEGVQGQSLSGSKMRWGVPSPCAWLWRSQEWARCPVDDSEAQCAVCVGDCMQPSGRRLNGPV